MLDVVTGTAVLLCMFTFKKIWKILLQLKLFYLCKNFSRKINTHVLQKNMISLHCWSCNYTENRQRNLNNWPFLWNLSPTWHSYSFPFQKWVFELTKTTIYTGIFLLFPTDKERGEASCVFPIIAHSSALWSWRVQRTCVSLESGYFIL